MGFLKSTISKLTFLRFLCSPALPIFFCSRSSSQYSSHSSRYKIASQTLALFDQERGRPILMEIFYPVGNTPVSSNNKEKGSVEPPPLGASLWKRKPEIRNAPLSSDLKKLPVIFFSHGHGGSRIESVWLFYELVQQGYLIASIDHFGNTWDLIEREEYWQRWHRAQDISFAIRALLKHPKFSSHLDENNIGFAGFSLGGLTGIWLIGGKAHLIKQTLEDEPEISANTDMKAATQSYYEPLIKAAFLMAPAYAKAFDPESLSQIQTPVYIIAGAGDKTVPKENAEYLAKWIPQSQLKILPGKVGHFVFLNQPTTLGKLILPKEIILEQASSNLDAIHKTVAKEAIAFFDQHLKLSSPLLSSKDSTT